MKTRANFAVSRMSITSHNQPSIIQQSQQIMREEPILNAPHRLASKRRLTSRRSALPLTGGYQRRIVFAGRPPPAFL